VRPPWRTALRVALWVAAAALLPACSAGARYRVLNFFFDGVPNPAAQALQAGGGSAPQPAPQAAGNYSKHPPFAKRQCPECHLSGTNKLIAPLPQLCLRCHKFELEKRQYVHAPVVSGFCKLCHDPHSSRNPFLLVIKPEELCFFCHNPEDIYRNPTHADREALCLTCHNPHADNRYFLKAGVQPTAPPPTDEPPVPQ
jgi:predicted CXXCH cytochrome family protein